MFTLTDAADLLGFANIANGTAGEGNPAQDNFENKTVKLGADIDLSGIEWTPIGKLDAGTDFKGEFNGDGKTISNLTMTLGDQGNQNGSVIFEMRRKPLEGRHFGKWEVLAYEGCFNHKKMRYLCRCTNCGSIKSIRADKLKSGKTTQCAECRRAMGKIKN